MLYRRAIFLIALLFLGAAPLLPAGAGGLSQDNRQLIETDAGLVTRTGNWTSIAAEAASGGSYLLSSSPDDALAIGFAGSSLDILYTQMPGGGTFAIEVDGEVLRTVSTDGAEAFGQAASVTYLDEANHLLRVYAVEGQVGLDAFRLTVPELGLLPNLPEGEAGYEYSYYYHDEKFTLDLSTDYVAVRFEIQGTDARRNALEAMEGLGDLSDIRYTGELIDLALVPLADGINRVQAQATLSDLAEQAGSSIEWVKPVFTAPGDPTAKMIATREIALQYIPNMSQADIADFNARYGLTLVRELLSDNNTFIVSIAPQMDTLASANALHEMDEVLFAAPNFVRLMTPSFTPNDTAYLNQWHLYNYGQFSGSTSDSDIDAPLAWDYEQGSSETVIAVLDEGVDMSHEDLDDKLVSPYDAIGDDFWPQPSGDDAHGTAVAGIAAAETDNSQGGAGVCPNCSLMPIRIAYQDSIGNWVTSDAVIANAIDWAWQNGADVLNNSWGGGSPSTLIDNAFSRAVSDGRGGLGSVLVVATGNYDNSSVQYPANLSYVIAVGASNWCDERKDNVNNACNGGADEDHWGSNFGPALDVVAPGHDIYTTDISGSAGYASGDYAAGFNGTSAAAPVVSGVMGLILASYPDISYTIAQDILEDTTDDLGTAGWDQFTGWGRANAYQAVRLNRITNASPHSLNSVYDRDPIFVWSQPIHTPDWYRLVISGGGSTYYDSWLQTTDICGGATCSVSPEVNLPGLVTISWSVQPWSATYSFGTESHFTFSIAQPVRYDPTGEVISSDGQPDYTWDTVDLGETHYQIYVIGSDGMAWTKWYAASSICNSAGTPNCSVKPEYEGYTLHTLSEAVDYSWYIRVYGPDGYGPWRNAYNFFITADPPPTPTGLTRTPGNGEPTFTWDTVSSASWHQLTVTNLDTSTTVYSEWLQKGKDVSCSGTCSIKPGNLGLGNADYQWSVQSYGLGGLSPGIATASFPLNLATPPKVDSGFDVSSEPLPVEGTEAGRASEVLDDSFQYLDLFFHWNTVSNASWYQLIVRDASDTVLVNQWTNECSTTSGSPCTYYPGYVFTKNETHSWQVRAWGPGGIGPWSDPNTFTYAMSPADTPTLVAPSGTISDGHPDFAFQYSAEVEGLYYQLQVSDAATSALLYDEWHYYSGCPSFPCSRVIYNPTNRLYLSNGNYRWRVRAWTPGGISAWSSELPFTVAGTAATTPSLLSPSFGSVLTDDDVYFTWNTASNAIWHNLEILDADGTTVLHSEWVQCFYSACGLTVEDLPAAENMRWQVRAWAPPGMGSFTAHRTFTILSLN
jgi:hypothetical protein